MNTSAELFWTGVGRYNPALWPVQAVLVVLAAILSYRVFARPGPRTDAWMKAFLSFAFLWNAVVFFLFYRVSRLGVRDFHPLLLCSIGE